MSCYAAIDEEKIRTQSHVREWTRSGFLDGAQFERISADLQVDFRRTNPFLRAVLFVFTVLIVAASIALFVITFHVDRNGPVALTCLVSSAVCYALAEYLIADSACIVSVWKRHWPYVRCCCSPSPQLRKRIGLARQARFNE